MLRLHELLMDRKNLKIIDENRENFSIDNTNYLRRRTNLFTKPSNPLHKKRTEPPLKKRKNN